MRRRVSTHTAASSLLLLPHIHYIHLDRSQVARLCGSIMASGASALKVTTVAAILMAQLLLVPSLEGKGQAAAASCKDERDCIAKCPSTCRDTAEKACGGLKDGRTTQCMTGCQDECQASCSSACHDGTNNNPACPAGGADACPATCSGECDKKCGAKPRPEYKACSSAIFKGCKKDCKAACKVAHG